MKSDWKQNPVVVAGLLAVALLVWGALWLRVRAEHAPPEPPPRAVSQDAGQPGSGPVALPYPEVPHDPFSPEALSPGATGEADSGTVDVPPRAAVRPRHRLQGVIGGTALLVDGAGMAHLVRAGDALGDLAILAVHPDRVEVLLGAHRSELTLEDPHTLTHNARP